MSRFNCLTEFRAFGIPRWPIRLLLGSHYILDCRGRFACPMRGAGYSAIPAAPRLSGLCRGWLPIGGRNSRRRVFRARGLLEEPIRHPASREPRSMMRLNSPGGRVDREVHAAQPVETSRHARICRSGLRSLARRPCSASVGAAGRTRGMINPAPNSRSNSAANSNPPLTRTVLTSCRWSSHPAGSTSVIASTSNVSAAPSG